MTDAGVSEAVSIGNYKGVMLCNRPFQGVSSTLAKECKPTVSGPNLSDNTKAAFLAGNPGEPLGLNVPILDEPSHAIKRSKKDTALSKHKKWLHDLQKERQELQEALKCEDERKRERHEKFRQREAKYRGIIRQRRNNNDDDESDGKDVAKRPMWALTKEGAEVKQEMMEDHEADDLINFANNLDLDQFMDDVEIKAKISQVEKQMEELQTIVNQEESEEKRLEQAEKDEELSERQQSLLNAENLSRFGGNDDRDDPEDDAVTVASTVLSECKSIRSVHSMRSLTALTRRAEAKTGSSSIMSEDQVSVDPKIITVDEDAGVRAQLKKHPSNLPYIHRNPAI